MNPVSQRPNVFENSGELRKSEVELNVKVNVNETNGRNDIIFAINEQDVAVIKQEIEDTAFVILKDEHSCFEERSCGVAATVTPGKCSNKKYNFQGMNVDDVCCTLTFSVVSRGENDVSDFIPSIEKSVIDSSFGDLLGIELVLVSESDSPTTEPPLLHIYSTMGPSVSPTSSSASPHFIDVSEAPTESPPSTTLPSEHPSIYAVSDWNTRGHSPTISPSERSMNEPKEDDKALLSFLLCAALYSIIFIVFTVRSCVR